MSPCEERDRLTEIYFRALAALDEAAHEKNTSDRAHTESQVALENLRRHRMEHNC